MNMKVYEGTDMSEIMSRIKSELGSDAVIFHTRKKLKGGIFGFFGREVIEVTAGTDIRIDERDIAPSPPETHRASAPPKAKAKEKAKGQTADSKKGAAETTAPDRSAADDRAKRSIMEEAGKRLGQGIYIDTVIVDDEDELDEDELDEDIGVKAGAEEAGAATGKRAEAPVESGNGSSAEVAILRNELTQLQHLVEKLVRSGPSGGPTALAPTCPAVEYLLSQEVDRDTAEELAEAAGLSGPEYVDTQEIIDRLSAVLAERISVTGPLLKPTKVARKKKDGTSRKGGANVVAFIGPTGVGKTTTLAKLAARYALADGRDVALVTADFFRIAAIRQLKTYADITSVPFSVVHSRQELDEAIEAHKAQDIVLIDTAGHSQNNKLAMEELRTLLADTHIDSYHLVVSATSKFGDLLQIVERFGMLPISSFVLTKLDESTSYGPLLSLLWTTNKPVSYLTNGQRVPEDIQVATAEKLSRLLVTGISG